MPLTARSLILDLLSTLRHGTMPVRALVEAGGLLGLEENNVRVSLARLHAAGRVERDERGRYRLGPAVAAIGARLRSWRDLGARTRAWRGDWVAVHCARLGRGPARRRRERALALLGFRDLEPGLSIRPDNLRGGIETLRAELVALATDDEGRDGALGRVFLMHGLDAPDEAEARGLWDVAALAREADRARMMLHESEARLAALDPEEAMIESFLVGGRVLRQLNRHPLLPPEILDPEPMAALLESMRRYDRSGRTLWAPFLARHDVPHRALPLDSRGREPALGLAGRTAPSEGNETASHRDDAPPTAP